MKSKVKFFLAGALAFLVIVPIINISLGQIPADKAIKWLFKRSKIYNTDFIKLYTSTISYPLGISINPEKAIIGKNGWLFLGDLYERSISNKRNYDQNREATAQSIVQITGGWNTWLRQHGVKDYTILLGPDKSTIYPEHLPDWAAPAAFSSTDYLLQHADQMIYIDTRPTLLSAKTTQAQNLYYPTDTHWTKLGGWIAFDTLAKRLSAVHPELTWPTQSAGEIDQVVPRSAGDLSMFLWLQSKLTENEIYLAFERLYPMETKLYSYGSGELIRSGANADVPSMETLTLVSSDKALNKAKVLWLRDSFGGAMAAPMSATFSDVLQVHYNKMQTNNLSQLVKSFKPDYVIITVVERALYDSFFLQPPPQDKATVADQ